jgi:hypothetical protein
MNVHQWCKIQYTLVVSNLGRQGVHVRHRSRATVALTLVFLSASQVAIVIISPPMFRYLETMYCAQRWSVFSVYIVLYTSHIA